MAPSPRSGAESGSGHAVAVIGGATAGAEVASRLAARGVHAVVFEQNARPYGKIEDGLPRWHVGLRRKEYASIGAKLAQPGVQLVPLTRIGRDIDFKELVNDWGFSAVVLACGAWRDRPLPLEGADAYVGRGLVYQNPFIIGFNHAEEAGYAGPRHETPDDTLVVGGGLASIDVVKVLMLETTRARLAERGIHEPLLELEVKGIPAVLARHGLAFGDLELASCTLCYRRRAEDMPLVELPEDAAPERVEKVKKARARVLAKAMEKYRFRFEPLAAPEGLVVEGARLVGLRFRRTRIEGNRVLPTDESFERRGACVISSIGSIPELLPGIATQGELLDFSDWELGRLAEYPTVFSAGNVVTGKGNIVASRKHAAHVEEVVERFLGLDDAGHAGEEALLQLEPPEAAALARAVAKELGRRPSPAPGTLAALLARARARQAEVGYGGDYAAWIERVTPPGLA